MKTSKNKKPRNKNNNGKNINNFSAKQLTVLNWWCENSAYQHLDAIICDGAIRSGKTFCMSLSFALWALLGMGGGDFAFCGKTIGSLRRNLVMPLIAASASAGLCCDFKISQNLINISCKNIFATIYLFGGKDEGSAALIQGMTLSGVMFDEVALMPRSFVEQALARCSVEKSRFWFNCNPESPAHWFYNEWILRASDKNALYLHFEMKDNPTLSAAMLARYAKLYEGVFYQRFVEGKWVSAHGAVYPMFSHARHVVCSVPICSRYIISCDYGTVNPASFGLWGENNGVWYRIREYYHDSRKEGFQLTDEEYYLSLVNLAGELNIDVVLVDPSAASFIQCIKRHGKFCVAGAENDVLSGISLAASALNNGQIKIHESCCDIIREFNLYRWNLAAQKDSPVKENDHAMDDMRYFASYIFGNSQPFFAVTSKRRF